MNIRNLKTTDYLPIVSVVNDWWGGRKMSDKLPRLFFEHFRNTSFVAEEGGQMVGFLIGFLSQSQPEEGYIHFVGVHPDYRKLGVGRALYERFFNLLRAEARTVVRCLTGPVNKGSIGFHTRMGFEIEPSAAQIDGVPVSLDHDGVGEPRVLFVKHL